MRMKRPDSFITEIIICQTTKKYDITVLKFIQNQSFSAPKQPRAQQDYAQSFGNKQTSESSSCQ